MDDDADKRRTDKEADEVAGAGVNQLVVAAGQALASRRTGAASGGTCCWLGSGHRGSGALTGT